MSEILAAVIILGIIIILLITFAINFLKSLGIEVKDFISFIKADQKLDQINNLSKRYNALNLKEKIYFLDESQKIFEAFSKMPQRLRDKEYSKYMEILDTYQKAKIDKWKNNEKVYNLNNIKTFEDKKVERDLRKISLNGNSINTRKINQES